MNTIKAIDGELALEVLGAPYGEDAQNEFFSERTEFMLDMRESVPVLEFHGRGDMVPEVIGKAVPLRRDGRGLWFKVLLDGAKQRARELYQVAKNGLLRASSGAINYLVRRGRNGELLVWPLAELSLVDTSRGQVPANHRAIALAKAVAGFKAAELELPSAWQADREKRDTIRRRLKDSPPEALATLISLHELALESPDIEWPDDPFMDEYGREDKSL